MRPVRITLHVLGAVVLHSLFLLIGDTMLLFFSCALPRRAKLPALAGACFFAAASGMPAAHAATGLPSGFTITTLGTLNNPGSSTVVRRVNSNGEAVGSYKNGNRTQAAAAFIVSAAAGFDEITDQQPTDFSASYAINDLGETAGLLNGPSSVLPFRSIRHTAFQLLPLLAGDNGGAAYGINQVGESVGISTGANGVHAVWWTRAGLLTGLPSLQGYTTTKALDINLQGDIVGYAGDVNKVAVLWPAKGNIVALGNLANYTSSQAESLNDKGDVVGSTTAYDPNVVRMRAVLWPAGSVVPQDLGALPGGSVSRARDIDSNGLVVGTSDSTNGNRAFVWTAQTGMQDLNSLSADPTIILVDAVSINKQGAILAIGIKQSDLPSDDTSDLEEHELPRQIVLLTPTK